MRTGSFTCRSDARRIASVLLLLLSFFLSCKPAPSPKRKTSTAPAGEQVRATVVTIETKLQPSNRTLRHTITIADGRARSGDELDHWRLFDLKNERVTFVDDVGKTFRTAPLKDLVARRKSALVDDLPQGMPRAQVTRANDELVIRMGGYERHLRIRNDPSIPPQLFAMMQGSEPVATPLAPAMRAAEEALLAVRGFPFADHAELPYGDKKLVVDRTVVSVAQQNVPAAMLRIDRNYRELPATVVAPKTAKAPSEPLQEVAPPPAPVPAPVTATVAPEKPKPAPVVKKKAPAKKKTVVKKAAVKKAPVKKAPPKKKAPVPKKAPAKKKPPAA